MSSPNPFKPITKPISVWNTPLKADFKGLFKALSKAVVHGATQKYWEIAGDAVEGLTAIGIERDAGQLSWLLIRRALTQATFDLLEASAAELRQHIPQDADALCDRLGEALEQTDMTLNQDVLERPADLPILEAFRAPFAEWLRDYGLMEAEVSAILARLPAYFIYAVRLEWSKRQVEYAPIKAWIDSPVANAHERELAWLVYSDLLQRQVEENLLNESFSLSRVYVPPRAYYEYPPKERDPERVHSLTRYGLDETEGIVVALEAALDDWLAQTDARDGLRVLSGDPGGGKSSFAKMYAAHRARLGDKVILVPLHRFGVTGDLSQSLDSYVKDYTGLPAGLLNKNTGVPRLFLIFDGLDELSKQGKVGLGIAQEFVAEIMRALDRLNDPELRLRVLINGRPLSIQANDIALKRTLSCGGKIVRPVLHLLPYVVTEYERKNYDDPQGQLDEDQRNFWWRQYGTVTALGYPQMPDVLRPESMVDITSQPLLNYLVALTYERHAENAEAFFGNGVNLNTVYDELLTAVYERTPYERRADPTHPAIRPLTRDEFVRLLEEIALAVWHGDGRTATVNEIEKRCEASRVSHILKKFEEEAKSGVTRTLLAFYFQRRGVRHGGVAPEEAFEFTHKSFGEYLTARRLVRHLTKTHKKLIHTDPEDAWDEEQALTEWAQVCGPVAISYYLLPFLIDEVSIFPKELASGWQQTLCRLIGWMLHHGMPMHKVEIKSYQEMTRQARNSEETLLTVLSACARRTETLSQIHWPNGHRRTSALDWITRLAPPNNDHGVVLRSLCFLNLNRISLYWANLQGADLYRANLRGTSLYRSDLRGANLQQANLQAAILEWVDMEDANLQGANLTRAILSGAYLGGANLRGADLRGATGLTQEQLDSADTDTKTKVDSFLLVHNDEAKKDEANDHANGINTNSKSMTDM